MKACRAGADVELSRSSFPDIFTRSADKPAPHKWDEPQTVSAPGFTWTSIKLQTDRTIRDQRHCRGCVQGARGGDGRGGELGRFNFTAFSFFHSLVVEALQGASVFFI